MDPIKENFKRSLPFLLDQERALITFGALVLMSVLTIPFIALSFLVSNIFKIFFLLIPPCLWIVLLALLGSFLTSFRAKPFQESSFWVALILALPFGLGGLVLWLFLSLYALFASLPHIGPLFTAFLAMGPLTMFLALFLLWILSVFLLFFLSPNLEKFSFRSLHHLVQKIVQAPLFPLLFCAIGSVPLLFVFFLLGGAFWATHLAFFKNASFWIRSLDLFFLSLGSSILLTPFTLFFFYWAGAASKYLDEAA